MVKLFACGARGPGFDSRSRRYDFRDWLSPASGRDMAEITLKRRKSSKQPTNQPRYRAYYHIYFVEINMANCSVLNFRINSFLNDFDAFWYPTIFKTLRGGKNKSHLLWNAKLTETRIFRELSIEIESSLIELKSSIIQLKSSLIQLETSLIQLLSSLNMYNKRAH